MAGQRHNVRQACVNKVKRLGDLLGRDRVFVGTVAFGPPDENYDILKDMAATLQRGSFEVNCSASIYLLFQHGMVL